MKKVLAIQIIFLTIYFNCFSQKEDYQWIFGDSCGIDFSNLTNPIAFISNEYNMYENFSSISDSAGNLLFYLNGAPLDGVNNITRYSNIYNGNYVIIDNGDSIFSDYSETQGSLIIPFPGHPYKYYLFHIQAEDNPFPIYRTSLYYSIIDMSANNGMGQVISKNNLLMYNSTQEKICGVKHGNGRDWWVVTHMSASSLFRIYLITPTGISNITTQSIGPYIPDTSFCYSPGQMKFSKQGDRLVLANMSGELSLYHFDRCTGNITSFQSIWNGSFTCLGFYGCSFSPSGKYLYASDRENIYQYDLSSINIPTSQFIVWQDTSTVLGFRPGQHLLGPDGKIYITILTDFPAVHFYPHRLSLSVINNPDVGGSGCNFVPYSFSLNGGESCGGFPNMCYYSLGTNDKCDSLTSVENVDEESNIFVYPNPSKGLIEINSHRLLLKKIKIFNLLSQELDLKEFESYSIQLDISILNPGLYFLLINTNTGNVIKKIVRD